MLKIHSFTFNDFQENCYLVFDTENLDCIIFDPGCNGTSETKMLSEYISDNRLRPTKLINTHCHIDHVLGNAYVSEEYGLDLMAHEGEIPVLESCPTVAKMYGIPYVISPSIKVLIEEGQKIMVGSYVFDAIFSPGHSPASLCFFNTKHKILIAGDVLFHRSIGRTDLPGGDYDTLINNIKTKLFTLPDDTIVYPGHGISTTIGDEKKWNPFFE
jgi:glyoxylase-like metal-dependent hydrolase (beta-lactamase superfamily II)